MKTIWHTTTTAPCTMNTPSSPHDRYALQTSDPPPCESENWNTYNACFIGRSWQIRSGAMFGATCVGAILLTLALESFRRMSRTYDRYIVLQHEKGGGGGGGQRQQFRPSPSQQGARSLLFLLQVVTAYILILLAVSFNGYIILSIFLGSVLSFFTFQWDVVPVRVKVSGSRLGSGSSMGMQ
ncbi:Ctr copper transporter family-domain-containing protein [Cladorrhinum sp. PSN332]|nr:Ctr copper transporter family-domain-containing protein [Cladorrhinum sp. PSN332]